MPTYNELHTTAFRFVPGSMPQAVTASWGMLRFPRSWLAPILELQQRRQPKQRAVSVANLNRAVRALVPDIAAVTRGVGTREHPGQWLYCAAQPEIAGLRPIIHAWLRSSVDDKYADEASQLWAQLAADMPTWETVETAGLGWPSEKAASADTTDATEAISGMPQELFQLVPEILAAELLRRSDRPDEFPKGFRRCPHSNGGVELMSWPPLMHEGPGGHPWPYSYRIRLSVQTVPFQPEPVLHVSTGLRRWCRTPPRIGKRRSANAYLLTDVPWIEGLAASHSFRMAPVRWSKVDDTWTLSWRNELRDLFDQISFDGELPDLGELTDDPMRYLTGLGEHRAAAIVYSTTGGDRHRVGAGTSARDRNRLINWVGDTLSDLITPAKPLPRVSITLPGTFNPPPHGVRTRLAEVAQDKHLTIEIHWDTERVRNTVAEAIAADLGLEDACLTRTIGSRTWETPELSVTVASRPIGALGSPLEHPGPVGDRRVRARRAALPRIDAVPEALGVAKGSTLAVVELRGPEAFPDSLTDPKAALRVGYAASGRLTQFLTPEAGSSSTNDLAHRAASAWMDLRRQLAGLIRTEPPKVNGLDLPHPVDTVAIFMLRRNATEKHWGERHQLPIAVWTSPDNPTVWARTLGMTNWQPYDRVLLALAAGRAFKLPDSSASQTEAFVSEVLRSTRQDRPVLLLTWTQNLRLDWEDLQNRNVVIDRPSLAGRRLNQLAPTLRHVMVRTHGSGETPQCYGITDSDRVGLPSGLFRLPGSNRVFASVAPKPVSAQSHGSPMGSRYEVRLNSNGRPVLETTKQVFNPQYVEFTVAALHDGDDPTAWVALAHAQRTLADTYRDTLTLPVQLHLARKATEYAIPDATMDDAGVPDESNEPQQGENDG